MAYYPCGLTEAILESLPERIIVTGADGQLGSALIALLGHKAIPLTQKQADFARPDQLGDILNRLNPTIVINPAAYTAVDKAEEEPSLAMRINGDAPGVIANWCAEHKIPMLHYSTDYVYPGNGSTPWREENDPSPCNSYGRSKLAGDKAVLGSGANALIFRTSWVYDAKGKNFLNTMLKLGQEREQLHIVGDQIGAPTYAPHLAALSLSALYQAQLQTHFPTGIYHAVNTGETSWHGFADAIFAKARAYGMPLAITQLLAIPTEDYPTPADRPLNSRLAMDKLADTFNLHMPPWEQGLADAFAVKTGLQEKATLDAIVG